MGKPSLKILMITHSSAQTGGGEDDFRRLVEGFSGKHRLSIVTPDGPGVNSILKYADDYCVIEDGILPFYEFRIKSYIKYFFLSIKKYIHLLPYLLDIKINVDVCFVNSSTLIAESLLLYILGIPYVVSVKELVNPSLIRKIVYWFYSHTAKNVIVISAMLKSVFDDITGTNFSVLIYSAVDEIMLENIDQEKEMLCNDVFRILNIGVVTKLKNQELVLKAAQKLDSTRKFEVFFVGRIIEYNYYDFLVSLKNQVSENVQIVFRDALDRTELLRLMKSSNCVVISSRSEGMSLVLAEALFFQKPILTTVVGAVPELIKDGVNGYLIDMENPDLLAEHISKLASDKESVTALCNKNRELFYRYFTTEVYLKMHEKVICKSLNE